MASEPVITPPLSSSASLLVDWLEFIAFFNDFGVARVGALMAAIKEQKNEPEENIAKQDMIIDQLREKIENEIIARQRACGDYYPFELSDDAEEFKLSGNWNTEGTNFIWCVS